MRLPLFLGARTAPRIVNENALLGNICSLTRVSRRASRNASNRPNNLSAPVLVGHLVDYPSLGGWRAVDRMLKLLHEPSNDLLNATKDHASERPSKTLRKQNFETIFTLKGTGKTLA